MCKKRIVLLLYLGCIFQSCATFKFKTEEVSVLNKTTLHKLNGNYQIYSNNYRENINTFEYHNLFREIDRGNLRKDTLNIDSAKNYQLGIHVLNKKEVAFNYIENNNLIRTRVLKAKFKKNGYLYLKNKNVKTKLIPYIFGRFDIKRTRLGINSNGDLILDISKYTGGGGFFIIGLNFDTYRDTKTYSRLTITD